MGTDAWFLDRVVVEPVNVRYDSSGVVSTIEVYVRCIYIRIQCTTALWYGRTLF